MSSKYIDSTSIIQVIGNVFNNPSLLEFSDKYTITEEDFVEPFHKIVFGSIYKIYELGVQKITLENISDFLSTRPKSEAIYKQQRGDEWLIEIREKTIPNSFDYYYNRLKKFTLLRAYDNCGLNIRDIYDPDNILDLKKKQLQEELLDNNSLEQIADIIDNKIMNIRLQYVDNSYNESQHVGEGILDLIDKFKESPEVGVPLYGNLINTITRGARLSKFYLRSAASGTGKTRTLIADTCNIGCNKIYDDTLGWISNGVKNPVLFIATEQDLSEVQTMMLAFISNVNEEHILNASYVGDEEDRVKKAAEILIDSPIYIEQIPDFSLKDIENSIKRNIRNNDVSYIVFDYIHTSMKILEEITKRSGGVRLREDNILFMLSNNLKNLCNIYNVFIISATQLSGDYKTSDSPDQTLLRGAKSIADKIDTGMLLLNVNSKDIESLEEVLNNSSFDRPIIKISIYKNRRGRYKGIYLWCTGDLGTCRLDPMFATTWDYELIQINNTKIIVEDSAF